MTWEERLEVAKLLDSFPSYDLDATIGYLFYKLDIIDNDSELTVNPSVDDIYRVKRRIWLYSLNIPRNYCKVRYFGY